MNSCDQVYTHTNQDHLQVLPCQQHLSDVISWSMQPDFGDVKL